MISFAAACFDLDGTLIDTEPIHLKAESDCLTRFGVAANDSQRPRTFGLGIEPGMRLLADTFGLEFTSVLQTYMPFWEEGLHSDLRLLPGADLVLSWLQQHNIPIALVTSSNTAYVNLVESVVDLKQIFRVKITSDNVQQLKPDPTAYLEAVDKLGTNPENCVGFEDSGAGIKALNKAGLFSVAVHPAYRSRQELQSAALKVETLNEIHSKLEAWFR